MIVKMKKLNVVGLISEQKKVLDTLRTTGCFEQSLVSEIADGQTTGEHAVDRKAYEELHQRLSVVSFAIENSERLRTEFANELKLAKKLAKKGEVGNVDIQTKKIKKQLFSYRREVTADQLNAAGKQGDSLYKAAQEIFEKKERIDAINKAFEQNKKEYERLELYKNVDVRLSDIADSKHLFMLLGIVKSKLCDKVANTFANKEAFSCQTFEGDKKTSIVFVSGPIEQKRQTVGILSTFKFVKCDLASNAVPKEEISRLREQNSKIFCEKLKIFDSIASDGMLDDLKLYHDYINLELEALDAQKNIGHTKKTYSIEGWIPAENAEQIVAKVKAASSNVECELLDGEEGQIPPTLTRNNALVSPYESVTNMFSPPNAFERDPNIFVAFFFFFFFGIMIGDAIYGLGLFVLTFVLLRCYKMDTGFKKLVMILCMGGVSAFIWGAIYNSWAAVGLPYNPILNPIEHPFDFLIISLGFGYVQIMFGFLLKIIANIKAGDWLSALCDTGWKLLIMIGGVLNFHIILSSFQNQFYIISFPDFPDLVSYIGLGLIFVGLLGMVATGGRHKTKIAGKILSGVGSLYDLVGILSDILSYCRLFGLALSGAIIGMVANILATDVLFPIPVVGYGLGIVVAVFFHLFNLALACLGAYVHNSRLQFVEFFGKFYEGGGKLFQPMGHCTKYTQIKQ